MWEMNGAASTVPVLAWECVSVLDPSSPQDVEGDTEAPHALSPVGHHGLGGCQDPCVFSS